MHRWLILPVTRFPLLAAVLLCCCTSSYAAARQQYYSSLGTLQQPAEQELSLPDPQQPIAEPAEESEHIEELQQPQEMAPTPTNQDTFYEDLDSLAEEPNVSEPWDCPQQPAADCCTPGVFACGQRVGNSGEDAPGNCCLQTYLYVGFEATFLKPRFEANPAFTVRTDLGEGIETLADTEFDYNLEFSPRLWLGADFSDGLGWRVSWWQFDHGAATAMANPPAGGAITHPEFADVDISTTISTDSFTATSRLKAYTIDLEATQQTGFGHWGLGLSGGLRYAHTEQTYLAQLRDTNSLLLGQINYQHALEGIGPTFALRAYRAWSPRLGLYCLARGSVLFGDGQSHLNAGEELNAVEPFTTLQTANRDDLLSIGEIQVGLQWRGHRWKALRPYISTAIEAQVWNGAGNASSETGTLGLFGCNTSLGIDW